MKMMVVVLLVAAVAAGHASAPSKKDKRGVFGEAFAYDGLSLAGGYGGIPYASHGTPVGPGPAHVGPLYGPEVTGVKVHKETVLGIPQPYAVPVPVEKPVPVPYEVKVPVAVPVERPVPVHVDRPVPYAVPVVKHVPYEVRIPYKVPVPVHVPYKVEKIVHVPHYIEKPAPPVKIIVRETTGWKSGGWKLRSSAWD